MTIRVEEEEEHSDNSIKLEQLEEQQKQPQTITQESIHTVAFEFAPKESYHVKTFNEKSLSLCYNTKQKMFLFIDQLGIVTWEWKKTDKRINRPVRFNVRDKNGLAHLTYCSLHDCYFAATVNNNLVLLNRKLEEVFRHENNLETILCMIYNPVSDELITSGVEGVKVWRVQQRSDQERLVSSLKEMANHQIVFCRRLKFADDWIRKIELDILNLHYYCCTTRDLLIYDFDGRLIRSFLDVHRMSITCCIYSPTAKLVLTGSFDCDVKVWSLDGNLVTTFQGHSKPISNLILNPFNSNLVISTSTDGFVQMWSLDIFKPILQFNFETDELFWIGITEEKYIYIGSSYRTNIYSYNNFISYWASTSYKIVDINLSYAQERSTRVVTVSEESTLRVYDRKHSKSISTILPIPNVTSKNQINSIAISRNNNSIYMLVNNTQIWHYFTKTNPSTLVGIWSTDELQRTTTTTTNNNNNNNKLSSDGVGSVQVKRGGLNEDDIQKLLRTQRVVEYGLNIFSIKPILSCRSIGILESECIYWSLAGAQVLPSSNSLLLLGLEDGSILACDGLIQGKKYFTLNCCKDPVVEISHDKLNETLITRIEMARLYRIQFWSLPELRLNYEIFCSKSITTFARLGLNVIFGYADGGIGFERMQNVQQSSSDSSSSFTGNRMPDDAEINKILSKQLRYEHRQRVEKVDSSINLKLFLSFSLDGVIKFYKSSNQQTLMEINLDETLSACAFLNAAGDLLVGWRSHLFKIQIDKVLPKKFTDADAADVETDDDERNRFELIENSEDGSVIYEDPELDLDYDDGLDNDIFSPFKIAIDLEKYLRPFELNRNSDGLLEVKVDELSEEEVKRVRFNEMHLFDSSRLTLNSSSFQVESVLESEREDPIANRHKIDLTLSAKIDKDDVKNLLVDLITEASTVGLCYPPKPEGPATAFPENYRHFPKFGTSPVSSPVQTPRTPPIRPPDLEVKFSKPNAIEKAKMMLMEEQFRPKPASRVVTEDPERERRFRERLPEKYEGTKLKEIKINSRDLIARAAAGGIRSNNKQQKGARAKSTIVRNQSSPVRRKLSPIAATTQQQQRNIKKRSKAVATTTKLQRNLSPKSSNNNNENEQEKADAAIKAFLESASGGEGGETVATTSTKGPLPSQVSFERPITATTMTAVKSTEALGERASTILSINVNKNVEDKDQNKEKNQEEEVQKLDTSINISQHVFDDDENDNEMKRNELKVNENKQSLTNKKQQQTNADQTEEVETDEDHTMLRKPPALPKTSKINTSNLFKRISRVSISNAATTYPKSSNSSSNKTSKNDLLVRRQQGTIGDPTQTQSFSTTTTINKADVIRVHFNNMNSNSNSQQLFSSGIEFTSSKLNSFISDANRESKLTAEQKLHRSQRMFEYYYLMNGQGIPKRVGSAAYVLKSPDNFNNNNNNLRRIENNVNQKSLKFNQSTPQPPPLETSTDKIDNEHFQEWLNKYVMQKHRLNERLRSAKLNESQQRSENLHRWSKSIERKQTGGSSSLSSKYSSPSPPSPIPTLTTTIQTQTQTNSFSSTPYAGSSSFNNDNDVKATAAGQQVQQQRKVKIGSRIFNREIQSAVLQKQQQQQLHQSALKIRNRPKSVTFMFGEDQDESATKKRKQQQQQRRKNYDDQVIVNDSYTMSQIEMDDIMQEVEKRVKNASSMLSSLTAEPQPKRVTSGNDVTDESAYDVSGGTSGDDDDDYSDRTGYLSGTESSRRKQRKKKTKMTNNKQIQQQQQQQRAIQFSRASSIATPAPTRAVVSAAAVVQRYTIDNELIENKTLTEFHTSHRLSLRRAGSSRTREATTTNSTTDRSTEEESNNSEPEMLSEMESGKMKLKPRLKHKEIPGIHFLIARPYMPSSIPSATKHYRLVNYPLINLEYKIPDCPERYLLPIRFPILYRKIISSLIRFKSSESNKPVLIRSKAF